MRLDREFRFRGNRDYLHSTSLFDDILRTRGLDVQCIDMKFLHRTNHQVSYLDSPPSPDETLIAEWRDSQGAIYVVERDELIRERAPYDEQVLANMFRVEGRSVNIPACTEPFSRVEAIIAGFKRLLHEYRTSAPGIAYAFARIRLQHYPTDSLRIDYSRDIGQFFQGNIDERGTRIGQAFFGRW